VKGILPWVLEISGIAAQIARSTGPVKPNGTEANGEKKISAALSVTTITNARESGKKKTNLQKRKENKP